MDFLKTTCSALGLAAVLTCGAAARGAGHEPSPADIAAARELGTEGVLLAEGGNCTQAIEKLSRAAALYAAPTIVVPLGECQIKVGKLVRGTENLQRVVREPLDADAPKPFVEAQQHAQALLDRTVPRIAKLVIRVKAPPRAKLHVRIDDTAVPLALLGAPRPTDPGSHVVVAQAPGFRTARQDVSLSDGESGSVDLVLAPLPHTAGPVEQGQDQGAPDATRRTAGYIGLGVGGLGIGAGAVLGLLALQKKHDLDGACPGGHCPPSKADEITNARNLGTASTIAFGVGVAAAAVGAWLVLGDPGDGADKASARVWVGPGSAGVAGAF